MSRDYWIATDAENTNRRTRCVHRKPEAWSGWPHQREVQTAPETKAEEMTQSRNELDKYHKLIIELLLTLCMAFVCGWGLGIIMGYVLWGMR